MMVERNVLSAKLSPQNLSFLRTLLKKIVIDLLAKFAVKSIIMMFKIEY